MRGCGRGCLCTIGTVLAIAWGVVTFGALLWGAALPITVRLDPGDDKILLIFALVLVVWLALGAYPGFKIAATFGCDGS